MVLLTACQPADAVPLVPVIGETRTPVIQVSTLPTAAPVFVGRPVALRIPALGLEIDVEAVGLDQSGAMAAPSWDRAGWYALGPRPGETGQAVIAGHLTTSLGTAGPFWRLADLERGQYVIVIDDRGREHSFRVAANTVFDEAELPLAEVFGFAPQPRLNLITCTGGWDWRESDFLQRRVVFADHEF